MHEGVATTRALVAHRVLLCPRDPRLHLLGDPHAEDRLGRRGGTQSLGAQPAHSRAIPRASDEGGSTFQTILAEATKIFQVVVGLPGRADRVLTLMERGDLNVQTPLLNMQVRRLERSVNRVSGGLVFATVLIAGAVLFGTDPALGKLMMGSSALPLVWMVSAGRARHPGRR